MNRLPIALGAELLSCQRDLNSPCQCWNGMRVQRQARSCQAVLKSKGNRLTHARVPRQPLMAEASRPMIRAMPTSATLAVPSLQYQSRRKWGVRAGAATVRCGVEHNSAWLRKWAQHAKHTRMRGVTSRDELLAAAITHLVSSTLELLSCIQKERGPSMGKGPWLARSSAAALGATALHSHYEHPSGMSCAPWLLLYNQLTSKWMMRREWRNTSALAISIAICAATKPGRALQQSKGPWAAMQDAAAGCLSTSLQASLAATHRGLEPAAPPTLQPRQYQLIRPVPSATHALNHLSTNPLGGPPTLRLRQHQHHPVNNGPIPSRPTHLAAPAVPADPAPHDVAGQAASLAQLGDQHGG